jgi:hypothetical protein
MSTVPGRSHSNPCILNHGILQNGTVYKDPPIFNHSSNLKGKDIKWKFQNIAPYYYKGSQCNVFMEWESGETTNKILKVTCTDNPATCSIYACENFPLHKPDWNQMKNIVKQEEKFNCMTNQAKLRLYTAPGLEITRTYEQALGLDQRNGNTLWGDAITLELT